MPRRAPGRSAQVPSSREAELEALLAERDRDLAEARRALAERAEQQTATAGVLQAISRAPTELQVVLDTIAATAAGLCGADSATIRLVDGDEVRTAANHGWGPPIGQREVLDGASLAACILREARTVHLPDVGASVGADGWSFDGTFREPDYLRPDSERPFGALVAAALVSRGRAIGVLTVRHRVARPFS